MVNRPASVLKSSAVLQWYNASYNALDSFPEDTLDSFPEDPAHQHSRYWPPCAVIGELPQLTNEPLCPALTNLPRPA
jgi:hypothetical protein